MADRVGQRLGNYRLIRLLGRGGFAEVYLGEHIHLNTQAAIKVLRTQLAGDDLAHFRTEARTIAHLVHPNIIQVLDFGVEGGVPFLVMAYAANGTLRQRHRRGIPLPTATIVGYVQQVASALQYAHNQRLVHRDIKPENMLLGRDNEVLLSDFGIALVTPSARAQSLLDKSMPNQHTWDPAGTVTYMAPEQIQGKPLPASDQYALAVVVYEWFSGWAPFNGAYMEVAMQHMSAPPPRLRERVPTISPDIEWVVLTALAKDPQQRFVSVQAFATALEQACQPELSTLMAPMPGISTPMGRQSGGLPIEAALSGPAGRTILRSAVITIGRRPDNQLIVNDPKVSSHHAEIRSMAQGYCLIDLHSTNGTVVNGQPLVPQTPHLLSPGDIVLFGDTRFTYEVSGASQVRAPTSDGSTVRAEPGYSGVVTPVVPPPVAPFNTGYGAQPYGVTEDERTGVPAGTPPISTPQPSYRGIPPASTPSILSDIYGRPTSLLERVFGGFRRMTGKRTKESQLSLFAIARANLEVSNRAYVSQVYYVQAGISGSKPANFRAGPFDVTVSDPIAPLVFDILIHVSDNIELQDKWHKRITYYPSSPATQLVHFVFKVVATGHSSIAIDFYHNRRWLKTIRLGFDAVEQSQLSTVSSKG